MRIERCPENCREPGISLAVGRDTNNGQFWVFLDHL